MTDVGTYAAGVIRLGSGLVYLAVGARLWVVARRLGPPTIASRALPAFALAAGIAFVVSNVGGFVEGIAFGSFVLEAGAAVVAAGAVLAFLAAGDREQLPLSARERALAIVAALAVAAPLGVAALLGSDRTDALYTSTGFAPSGRAGFHVAVAGLDLLEASLLALAAALGVAAQRSDARARGGATLGLVSLGVGAYAAFDLVGAQTLAAAEGQSPPWVPLASGALLLMAVACWIAPSRWVAWSLLAIAIAGIVLTPVTHGIAFGTFRSVGAVLFGFGVARAGLLGGRTAGPLRAGALAPVALAILFVVAQVAQNFFAAQYGLIMGGVVAGCFLFAAQPVQRAFERRSAAAPPAADRSSDEIYRNALRVAMRDKVLTRDEEVHLHRLAERLGIGAGRAHELLAEVEREQAGRRDATPPKDAS